MNEYLPQAAAGVAALAWALPRVKRRLELSRAKHRSLVEPRGSFLPELIKSARGL